jgi:long-chain fatty acid transport protein
VFEDASVEGDEVRLNVPFPFILRAGAEAAPLDALRIEGSFVYEGWSRQKNIDVTPKDVWMRGITGVGDYQVGRIRIQRDMKDVWSARLGGEYTFDEPRLAVRMGTSYETSAFGDDTLSPLTLDASKVLLAAGATVGLPWGLSVDLLFAHVFVSDPKVRDSELTQPTALRPAPGNPSHIANGDYTIEASVVGLGISYMPGEGG